MTKLVNDPADFPRELVEGFVAAHPQYVRAVSGGVARATRTPQGKTAIIVGGGTGHYPAFMGWVGQGMADGAVCGNIFSSPSASQAVSVAKSVDRGGGIIIALGNYAGDVLHFGAAVEQLRAEGIDARTLVLTDDIASAPPEQKEKRRGIGGFVPVYKIIGAAAEEGMGPDEIERVFTKANDRTRTLGVAFSGCTLPGADKPLFDVPEGRLALGLGVHGEPGIAEMDLGTAAEVGRLLVTELLKERPADADGRVVALLNGLGTAKYEELFVTWRDVKAALEEAGVQVVDQIVGELVTSLDMGGVSLTLTWVDDELERLWRAPVDTPGLRFGTVDPAGLLSEEERAVADACADEIPEADEASRGAARRVVAALEDVRAQLEKEADELGRLDAVAGDGDHGIGMVRGATAALGAAREAYDAGAGLATTLARAGQRWSDEAGGTSGALWGGMILAAAGALSDTGQTSLADTARAVRSAVDALRRLGGAELGDKTMLDVLAPFADAFEREVERGATSREAWSVGAVVARDAADSTAQLRPRIGRARPLAERSVGHPDPGAVSAAVVVRTAATALQRD